MKRIFCSLLSLLLAFMLSIPTFATTIFTFGDWAVEAAQDSSAYAVVSCSSKAEEIAVPASVDNLPVTGISPHAFMRNDTLASLTASAPLAGIGEYAFFECTALQQVDLPQTLTVLGEGAFSGAASLAEINLDNTQIAAVEAYSFSGTALSQLTLPATCVRIADDAFLNCSGLQTLEIPNPLCEIGESALNGCEQLTIICQKGSKAAEFAEAHGIPYQPEVFLYPYLKGDADGDGHITILDATRVQRILARYVIEDVANASKRGDIDGDGLNILDATALQRYMAGMGNPYGVNETIYR